MVAAMPNDVETIVSYLVGLRILLYTVYWKWENGDKKTVPIQWDANLNPILIVPYKDIKSTMVYYLQQ